MGWKVPLFGDGTPVWTPTPLEPVRVSADDARLRDLAELSAATWSANQERHDRGTIDLMVGQLVSGGQSPEQARQTAVTAVRRLHGDQVPYRPERPRS